MRDEPSILVLADDDQVVGPICHGLDAAGWRTVTARNLGSALSALGDLPVEAVLIDARQADAADDAALALRAAGRPRRLPILGLSRAADPAPDPGLYDLAMSGSGHPVQVRLRLESLMRSAVAEEEILLRRATFAARGVDLTNRDDPAPLRVLAAGPPDRRVLALSNALEAAGCEVVAAPTPYTAFDYLHERAFDAAVLWGGQDRAPAQSIAAGMKRNTRLHQVPIVLYLTGEDPVDLGDLYGRGFADVADATTPEPETAVRVAALARAHRDQLAVRRALEAVRASGLTDPATGLFTPELFAAHLSRVVEAAQDRRRPLSVCVMRVASDEDVKAARRDGWLARALPQIGAMVSRLIRVEDTAARLSDEVFALALPATDAGEASSAAERIAAVIGCTAFDAGPGKSPFVANFDVGVAERKPGESPGALLERASAASLRRS